MFVRDNEFTGLGWLVMLVGAIAFAAIILRLFLIVAAVAVIGFLAFVLLGQLIKFILIRMGKWDAVKRIEAEEREGS